MNDNMLLYRWRHIFISCLILSTLFFSNTATSSDITNQTILRRVIIFYSFNKKESIEDQSIVHNLQTMLNYYGILPDFMEIEKHRQLDDNSMKNVRGVIAWLQSSESDTLGQFLDWLELQLSKEKKVILIANVEELLQNSNPKSQRKFLTILEKIGLDHAGKFIRNRERIEYEFKDDRIVEFEREYPPFIDVYEQLIPINEMVKSHLIIKRKDIENSKSSMIVTSPAGGFAHSGFIFWEDPLNHRKKWYLNPFRYLKEALKLDGLPYLDPTTLNGMRVAFSRVHGQGLLRNSKIGGKSVCGQILFDQVFKRYNLPISVSVDVSIMDPTSAIKNSGEELIKSIIKLPNIEAALSITSHPHDKPYPLDQLLKYFEKNVLGASKKIEMIFWDKDCSITSSELDLCQKHNAFIMKDAHVIFDDDQNTFASVAPLYETFQYQYLINSAQPDDVMLTHNWEGPRYGFRNALATFRNTDWPYRIKPIEITYHFLSGEYHSSTRAVQHIYEWVLEQGAAFIFTSDYLRMVYGYLTARILKQDENQFIVENYGRCLTLRFDEKDKLPDLSRCQNVIGYAIEPQGLYISLSPDKNTALIVLSKNSGHKLIPFIRKADGFIKDQEINQNIMVFNYEGTGKGRIEIDGLFPQKEYRISGKAINKTENNQFESQVLVSDLEGRFMFEGIGQGQVKIELVKEKSTQ